MSKVVVGTGGGLSLFLGILGYIVYGNLMGAVVVMILGYLLPMTLLLSLVPWFGVALQSKAVTWISVGLLEMSGLTSSWLTELLVWFYLTVGWGITVLVTLFVAIAIIYIVIKLLGR